MSSSNPSAYVAGVSMIGTSYSSWFAWTRGPLRRRPKVAWRVHSTIGARPSGCRSARLALSVWLHRDFRELGTFLQPEGRAPVASHSLSKKSYTVQGRTTQSPE